MRNTIRMTAIAAALLQAGSSFAAELEEVVVTAQRKAESLQEASVALDVVSSDQLTIRGITNSEELSRLVPALTITNGGGLAATLFMRGVGNTTNNSYLDPAIIINYDGVPLARASAAAVRAYYDVERVEVLKGPQGTLYGRNTTGGNINIVPVKPQLGETEGYVSAGAGEYDLYEFEGAVNVPLGDSTAMRLSAKHSEHDGWNKDGTNDEDFDTYRAQLYTEFSDSFNARVAFDYHDIGGVGPGTSAVGTYAHPPGTLGGENYTLIPSGLPANEGQNTDAGNAYRQGILSAPGFGFLNPIQDDYYLDGELWGINAELNWNTDAGTLTLVPAYRSTEQDSRFGAPGFNTGWWQEEVEQTSLEVRWAGETDSFEYIVGAFYIDEEIKGNNTFNQEFVLPLQDYEQTGESWAVFTEATFNLTDNARVIGGIRYTDDEKDFDGGINNYIAFCGGIGPGLITPPASFAQGCHIPGNMPHFPTLDTPAEADAWLRDNGWASVFIPIPPGFLIPLNNGVGQILHAVDNFQDEYQDDDVTYRVAVEYDLLEDSMLYASFETGYRAGGFQTASAAQYKPEYLDAYTIGMKNRLLGGAMQLNLELFRWEYKDQQVSYFTLQNGVLANLTDNVGEATNQGFDVDMIWALTENTLFTAKVQYLDATYDELVFVTAPPRDNINCPYEITGPGPELTFTCSNNDSIYSPEWVYQFGLQQTFPLGGMDLTASIFTTYTDDQVTGFTNLAHEVIDAYWMTDVDLTLTSADETWSVSAYARNLEDDRNVRSTQTPLLGIGMANYGPDMTYGARIRFNF